MVYRIKCRLPADREMKRVITGRIDDSMGWIEDHEKDPDLAVHEVRKNMKKIRGALRLFRDALPGGSYGDLNIFYRDLGRKFAGPRDSLVLYHTMQDLEKDTDASPAASFMVAFLRDRYRNSRGTLLDHKEFFPKTYLELQSAKRTVEELELKGPYEKKMKKGLERVYGRGRRAMKHAGSKPTPGNYHEWRKEAKYLWYHVRLLQDAWPAVMQGYRKSLRKLSSELGREHDLSELNKFIMESGSVRFISDADREVFSEKIEKKRMESHSGIWLLAGRLYSQKSVDFAMRIFHFWKVTRNHL